MALLDFGFIKIIWWQHRSYVRGAWEIAKLWGDDYLGQLHPKSFFLPPSIGCCIIYNPNRMLSKVKLGAIIITREQQK